MRWKLIGLGVVLADFAALNAYVVWQYGYTGFLQLATANAATVALLVDVTIALGIFAVWMWRDARDRGLSPVPYMLLMAVFGSVGALAYLIRRELDTDDAPAALPARAR
jgi:hypothetical protein